MKYIWII